LEEDKDEFAEMERAIEDGDLDCVRRLVDEDPNLIHLPLGGVERCSVDQLLNYAAWQGKPDIAKFLIERGANLNWRGNSGFTPLHYAARHNHPDVAQLLIEAGADIEVLDESGFTPLFRAVRTGEVEERSVARVLEDHGAVIDLNTAICFRRMEWVRDYLRTHPNAVREVKFPDYLLEDMVIAIQCQIWSESAEFPPNSAIVAKVIADTLPIMETLIQQGANPNIGSALHTAVQLEDPAIAELLIRSGADPNRDVKRKTYLPSVAKTEAMREMLKRHGAHEDPQGPRDFVQELMDHLRREGK
jgi:ankyrin repeat protein